MTARWLSEGSDVVLGPAADGGYVLIGLTRLAPELFSDMIWGEDSVLAVTRERLRRRRWHWSELPVRADVDRPADLVLLADEWLRDLR